MKLYRKIQGLKLLQNKGIPVPPYLIFDINSYPKKELSKVISNQLKSFKIPNNPGDSIGVTIRVSLSVYFDKSSHHGGLHVTDPNTIIDQVIKKFQDYGKEAKIFIQNTIDAFCSGTLLIEKDRLIIETILGDAPLLLEGKTNNYESWIKENQWIRKKTYIKEEKEINILSNNNLKEFDNYAKLFPPETYLEWSISKKQKIYFYEYLDLNKNSQKQ